jgi:hypothetical protein
MIPYIQYAVFKDYIAKNLCERKDEPKSCCQGSCYLEKQIKKSSDSSDTSNTNTTKKITTKDIKEFLIEQVSIPKATVKCITHVSYTETRLGFQVIKAIFVPPKA